MAVNGDSYGYFWDSSDGDRKYSSDSFAKVFNQFFTTGVFNGNFAITANGGMEIKCSGGYANIQGRIGYFDETLFTLEAAHSTYPRRDAIVVACDYVNRAITLRVEQGQYSSTNAPRYYPTRSDEVYELVVGYVYVGAGVTEITTANIEDYRFSKVSCGIVTGTVEEIDVEQLTTKLEYNFTQWFNNIKGQLSEDAAGNLQNEIDELVDNLNASQIDYSNSSSGLESTKIQGAIDEVAERIDELDESIDAIKLIADAHTDQLTANNKSIYFDYQNGEYGYNTSASRGADTFVPFKRINTLSNLTKIASSVQSGSWNCSSYKGYENFTVDNFIIVPVSYTNTVQLTGDPPENNTTTRSKSLSNVLTYSNGVLTLSSVSLSFSIFGNTSSPVSVIFYVDVYLLRPSS